MRFETVREEQTCKYSGSINYLVGPMFGHKFLFSLKVVVLQHLDL